MTVSEMSKPKVSTVPSATEWPSASYALAHWATRLAPSCDDYVFAELALRDTVAVAIAARTHHVVRVARDLPDAARWAVAAHVLDFDDLHVPTTTHISAVCAPAAIACGGGPRAYLAAAGVMARLGAALGWPHYQAGWHATCTAGAPAAAVAAGISLGLDAKALSTAIALAIPGAGGTQRAFGTDAKSLQVGFAVDAGIRAAKLAAAGARADPRAVDAWLTAVKGDPTRVDVSGPTVPGGLAIKLFPCCYALQRPLSALAEIAGVDAGRVRRVTIRTPKATVAPLIHHRPDTGLQAKFSLEYAVAAALLDKHQGFASFGDDAVRRPEARRLMELVDIQLDDDDSDELLAGEFEAEVETDDGAKRTRMRYPPGSPRRPASTQETAAKMRDCLFGSGVEPASIRWPDAAAMLRDHI